LCDAQAELKIQPCVHPLVCPHFYDAGGAEPLQAIDVRRHVFGALCCQLLLGHPGLVRISLSNGSWQYGFRQHCRQK